MSKMKKNFFGRNNISRSSAFRKFLFYQNIICFDWVMNLFLSWVMFSIKKVSFPAKTAGLAVHYFLHAFLSDYFCFAFQICAHAQFFGKIKTNASRLYCTKALLICLENGFSHSIPSMFHVSSSRAIRTNPFWSYKDLNFEKSSETPQF